MDQPRHSPNDDLEPRSDPHAVIDIGGQNKYYEKAVIDTEDGTVYVW